MATPLALVAPRLAPALITGVAASGPIGWALAGLIFVGGVAVISSVAGKDIDFTANRDGVGLKTRKA